MGLKLQEFQLGRGEVKIPSLEGLTNQLPNIIPNQVPVSLEKDTLKTIRPRGFVGAHAIKGMKHFILTDRLQQGLRIFPQELRNIADMEWCRRHIPWATEVGFKKPLGLFLEDNIFSAPNPIGKVKAMDPILLPPNYSLGMEHGKS